MDAIAPIGAATQMAQQQMVAAPVESAVAEAPDPTAVGRFAARLSSATEVHLGAIGDGVTAKAQIQDPSRTVGIGATEEAGLRGTGDTPYDRVFRFFTQSEDPLMGDLTKTREMLAHQQPVENLGDLYRLQHSALQASAELTLLNVKSGLLMHTGFEAKRSVEKLVQQQG